jgi:hypothetical protein
VNNMSISYLQFLAAIIILSCILIYGIGNRSSDNSAQSPIAVKSSEGVSSSEKNNANMKREKSAHQSPPMGKPGAAVSLKNTEPFYAPAPGIYEYQLQLASPHHTGKMIVDVSTSDGITIVSSERRFEFVLQEGGEYKLPLTLNAGAEGRFYIQLQVSTVVAGQTSMRAITAILQVGAPMGKMQKTMTNGSAGKSDSVISLPAQETISPR